MGKARQCLAKAVQLVGVARKAGYNFGVTTLDGTCRAPQGNHAGRTPHRQMFQPAKCKSGMLREAYGAIRM